MSRPKRVLENKRSPSVCARMSLPRSAKQKVCYTEGSSGSVTVPRRVRKKVRYTEVSSGSTTVPRRVHQKVCYAEVSSESTTVPNPQVHALTPSRPALVSESPAEKACGPNRSSSSSMPALVPIWPPTLPSPVRSESPPLLPYDFEQQYALEGNYLQSLLTSESLFGCFRVVVRVEIFFFRFDYAGTNRCLLWFPRKDGHTVGENIF